MKALVCPGCRKKMSPLTDGGVTLDACTECNGLWLDKGELEARGAKLPACGVEFRGDRRCPRCDYKMMVRPSKVVHVDYCPDCSGVYLDHGELAILVRVARLAQGLPAVPTRGEAAAVGPERPTGKRGAARRAESEQAVPQATGRRPAARKAEPQLAQRVAGIQPPGVPAAKPPARAPAEPRYVCDVCKGLFPLSQQVVGAELTVCPGCARKKGIKADLAGRRRAELGRKNVKVAPGSAEDFWAQMMGEDGQKGPKPPDVLALLARLLR